MRTEEEHRMAGTFRGRSRRHLIALVAFGLPALAAPGRADWLLTRDGARIETRGPWTVKGKLVVFTLASGTLSSLRTTEVDLEASAQSTAEAQARAAAPPAAEKPAEKPPPVLVLTDADVEHVDDDGQPLAGEAGGSGAAEGGEASQKAPPGGGLAVVSWDQVHDADRNVLEIYGVVRNGGRDMMANVTVEAAVYDQNGLLLTTGSTALTEAALEPGATANFRLAFPGLTAIAAARFEARGTPIASRVPAPSESAAPPPPTGSPVDAPGAS